MKQDRYWILLMLVGWVVVGITLMVVWRVR